VDHQVVNEKNYLITIMNKDKNPSFLYGVSVGGNNFTDRVRETRRLKLNFENGLNVILISPRRMGKTSLVKHVAQVVDKDIVQIVYMDIYDCRSEYDFYNKFAEAIMT
jgi:predicted AAA+ superfamily ATPase